jgi:hypothetical protein
MSRRRSETMASRTQYQDGSALVMALVMVFVVGLIGAAAVSYASTSLSASNSAFVPARAKQNDVDSALRAAVEYIKADAAAGGSLGSDLGAGCPSTTFVYPGLSGPVSVAVCPQEDSFVHSGWFRSVLLTLGTDPSEGVVLSHNGDTVVGGSIFSNSILSLGSPTNLKVTGGPVWAWGNCTRPGNVTITNPTSAVQCNASATFGGVRPKVALDPADPTLGHTADWQPASTPASMTPPTIPPCAGNKATLSPGVYSDPAALSALTTSCNTVTLSAGVYFLNFPTTNTPWSISKTVTAVCDATGEGAQLVFANQSKLGLTGTLNIPCGRKATAKGPLIALYGLKSALGTLPAQTGCIITVGGCSIIDPGSNSGELNIADEIYLPKNKLSGTINVGGASKIATALILRTLNLNINPNICLTCAAIGNDTNAPIAGDVVFTASLNGTPWADTDVVYDPTTFVPTTHTWVKRF